jgi:hypothetical protein
LFAVTTPTITQPNLFFKDLNSAKTRKNKHTEKPRGAKIAININLSPSFLGFEGKDINA